MVFGALRRLVPIPLSSLSYQPTHTTGRITNGELIRTPAVLIPAASRSYAGPASVSAGSVCMGSLCGTGSGACMAATASRSAAER